MLPSIISQRLVEIARSLSAAKKEASWNAFFRACHICFAGFFAITGWIVWIIAPIINKAKKLIARKAFIVGSACISFAVGGACG